MLIFFFWGGRRERYFLFKLTLNLIKTKKGLVLDLETYHNKHSGLLLKP